MELAPMYKGVPGDFTTGLSEPFDPSSDTTMSVYNASILPAAPNWITVRMQNQSCLATFKYTGISDNTLTGLTFEESDIPLGETAIYPVGSLVYWSLSNKLLNNIIDNIEAGGATGTTNYEYLDNKPKINSVELIGDKTAADLSIASTAALSAETSAREAADATLQLALQGKLNIVYSSEEDNYIAKVDPDDHILKVMDAGSTAVSFSSITGQPEDNAALAASLDAKVDVVSGKQLSTEDYSSEEKTKLSGIAAGAQVNLLEGVKVNGESQPVLDKTVDIAVPTKVSELENDALFETSSGVDSRIAAHDSSADAHADIRTALDEKLGTAYEPAKKGYVAKVDEDGTLRVLPGDAVVVSFASITGEPEDNEKLSDAFEGKVDKVAGKGLSETDFTSELKEKLEGIEEDAQKNVQSDWTSTSGDSQILHKPFISTGTNMEVVDGKLQAKTGTTADTVCAGDDVRLSDTRTPTKHAASHTDGTDDIQTANGFRTGLLSAEDWVNFNAKQDAITPKTAFNKDFGTSLPEMDGTASAGLSDTVARADHVHPTDTTRASSADLTAHLNNTGNPHVVTAEQIGLGNVENGAQVNKIEEIRVNSSTVAPVDKTVNVSVPTKVSELENDALFETSSGVDNRIATHDSSQEAHADIREELSNKLGTVYTSAEDGYIAKVDSYDHILKVVPGGTAQVAFADITGNPVDNTSLAMALDAKQDTITPNTAFNKDFGNSENTVCEGNDARLSDARTPLTHVHEAGDIVSGTVDIERLPIISTSITLSASGWNAETKQQSVTVTGVTAGNLIQVGPDVSTYVAYIKAEVRCISQAADSLTFACTTVPSVDLTVNVVITG